MRRTAAWMLAVLALGPRAAGALVLPYAPDEVAFEVMIGPGFSSPAFALSPDGVFLAGAGDPVAAFWDEVGAEAAYRGCADLDGDQDVTFVDDQLWRVARERVAATGAPSCGLGGEAALAPLLGWILGRRRWTGRRP